MVTGPNAQVYGCTWTDSNCKWYVFFSSTSLHAMPPGHAVIRYNNLGSAVYAKEKLNGFEYPPGNRLAVSYIDDGDDRNRYACIRALPTK